MSPVQSHSRLLKRRDFLAQSVTGGLAFAGLVSGVGGCANWRKDRDGGKSILQQPQLAPNAVVIEIAFVRVTDILAAPIHELWGRTDEQHLSVEVRRNLYANGLRSGTLGTELPSVLRDALDEQKVTVEEIATDPSALRNPTSKQYRLQCRSGKLIPVAVSPDFRDRKISVLESGVSVEKTFTDCQCVFELEAAPLANGMAAVHLMPLVEFGEAKNRPIGANGEWQVGIRKERRRFTHLAISMELRPGETVLLTTTDPAFGVGQAFFAGEEPEAPTRLMLLRLAQTQGDGVFEAVSNATRSH